MTPERHPTACQMLEYVTTLGMLNSRAAALDDLNATIDVCHAARGLSIAKQTMARINNMPVRWMLESDAVY